MPAYPESGVEIARRSLFDSTLNYVRQEIIVIVGLSWRVVICGGLLVVKKASSVTCPL